MTMIKSLFYIVAAVTLLTSLFAVSCKAQVTFSRDWNAGKRAPDTQDMHAVKSAATLCHMLMNQIRQLANCEARIDELDAASAPIYTSGR